ncbi:DegT/DnrJ/EryC1/StrS family aminotransferase [Methanobrevibacter sp. DSM 116169]|uniref:DegT/DnrJ/EryC1/StrS family aminotransferase n=1 Tax=Methanobrevibacter sp. DSM 116169 TaxID=3242727 RepID=UPI0038FCBF63
MEDNKVSIANPNIGKEEIEGVLNVLKSGMIAQGPKVEEFEKKFASWIGSEYAIATNSGTSALHTALLCCGIGKGDEVITSPFTFIASGNSIVYTGGKPIFADITLDTYNIDPNQIETLITDKTKAIMPVHLYGQPAKMDEIKEIADKHDLYIVEDAAQAHGAKFNNKCVGDIGDLGCFSFYPTKNMTTSEGGIITTNNEEFYELAKKIRAHGASERYYHDMIGYNYRMTDIAAAIGIAQMDKIEEFNMSRNKNANYLNDGLKDIEGIKTPFLQENTTHVYHQYTIFIENGKRDEYVEFLNQNGIGTGIHYPIPLYNQPIYKELEIGGSCKNAEEAASKVISLPVHPSLSENDLNRVIEVVKEASNKFS